eukprot:CAMPEP_0174349530 /NCGR_PEP_ID=MMETSP0811_2-20130205/6277_1 /TAXON_ID=73025 ORGANISM="Eutreptiella gymnastica-like, Strain CCMP1594" /NCGR_SAMPLE_ID=MMETSP0811_2 /ASSEMBLY_ACC=CAM_ASM_000667 /LENGTH=57 /DNA_ID=CAMNT_0015476977 /DNA_START=1093 /DNA_END=1263 /DNA_ORIENTATION=-
MKVRTKGPACPAPNATPSMSRALICLERTPGAPGAAQRPTGGRSRGAAPNPPAAPSP